MNFYSAPALPPKPSNTNTNTKMNMDQASFPSIIEVLLYGRGSAGEREKIENLADLYSIIVCVDNLEKAYIKDSISATDYTPACSKLIAQFKTAMNLTNYSMSSIEEFTKEYQMNCPAALNRLRIGVPATIEHSTPLETDGKSAKYVAEAVQYFITLMDSLKLNMVAVDQIHPVLADLMQSLNRVSSISPDFEGREKIRNWLVILNKMKASEELTEDQARQLMFDLEQTHSAFYRSLADSS